MPSIAEIRSWFPTLTDDFAFLENAGGSQVPAVVADGVRDYMLSSYVQLGAGYEQSKRATAVNEAAHAFIETFVNAEGVGRVILGPSTTALTTILAASYGETLRPGDEIVIAETNHEANAGPWARLERYGAKIRIWKVDPTTYECPLSALEEMLNERTRIVALPHVSNLLGHVVDVKAVTEAAHRVGARVIADGVAYAPHRAIDVAEWGVDWYVYSTYKVFGPHMAALFGRHDALAELTGPNHFFIPTSSIPYTFELGGASHEGCAGLLAVQPFLRFLAGRESDDRETVVKAFDEIERLELPLQYRVMNYLREKPGVTIVGPGKPDRSCVGTISFVSDRVASDAVSAHTDSRGVGIRHGHMYAYRLCQSLGIPTDPGVVRISLLHYNTDAELDRLFAALDEVL
ncbi:cysteine desulfurase-like protein [Fimbriimonas ginsengisoli]|uniref:Cysteine desulfurase n=1 Tax=Fimbriimonas ginsengisoli Gsoil 348 TaxID=661478 RepID=A0A068NLA9_FIMGI|nr:cysteine desulfurase-like protein [Fimbriimonas ginsengisoli]AIE84202.1 cysteine desulfurase [Fimbriimonas ginsengisoli Gsoil 348]